MTIRTTTCFFNKVLGTFKVGLVARHLIEFAERHLDDRVSTRTVNLSFVGAKGLAHQIGILDGHIQKVPLARSTIVGHSTLDEMSAIVELVRVDLLPLVGAPPTAQARTFISDACGQIAIRLLSLCDDVDY